MKKEIISGGQIAPSIHLLRGQEGMRDFDLAAIIEAIRQLIAVPKKSRWKTGFHVRESSPRYGAGKTR